MRSSSRNYVRPTKKCLPRRLLRPENRWHVSLWTVGLNKCSPVVLKRTLLCGWRYRQRHRLHHEAPQRPQRGMRRAFAAERYTVTTLVLAAAALNTKCCGRPASNTEGNAPSVITWRDRATSARPRASCSWSSHAGTSSASRCHSLGGRVVSPVNVKPNSALCGRRQWLPWRKK